MHAFLLVGKDEILLQKKVENLSEKLKIKINSYEIKKIEDVRNLNKTTRLKILEPTGILIKNINEVGEEALNAFLKNLEEPQENLFYILTAPTQGSVLPTITSRCQVIKVQNDDLVAKNEKIEKFMELNLGQKLAFVDGIRDRGEAVKFIEEYIGSEHEYLHTDSNNLESVSKNLEIGLKTLNNLKANGNVSLQLANFVINLV